MISDCLVWSRAGFVLLSSFSIPPQQSPPGLSLIGPDGGLADVVLQDLRRFLGAFGLEPNPESYIPLGAAGLSTGDLKLLLPCTSTAPLDEQLQHCPLVSLSLFPCSSFLLLLFPYISILPLTPPLFLCHFRVFRCRGGVQSGVCGWRGSPLHSLVHQRSQGGEAGCCGVPSITLLNDPGVVVGVKSKEQNVGVGQEISKRISCNSPSTAALLIQRRKVSLSLSSPLDLNRERVPEPTAFRHEVKVLLSCSPLRTKSNPELFGALDVALIT